MNMVLMEVISNIPRIQRFWIKCPAPGMSHPKAGAMTAMPGDAGVAVVFCASAGADFVEFAIQMITISF
jgi:hypothetical protein